MPMGASACSMARASSSGGLRESLRQSSLQINSPSSSPVLFEATNPSGPGPGPGGISRSTTAATASSAGTNYPPARHGGSAPSLPGSVVQSVNNSPARAVSVDEAASLALANLLEIDETQSNSGGQSATSATTASANNAATARRYQHALSVRVPPNQHGTAAPSGAIPRRQSRSSVRSQNQSDEN